MKHLVTVFLAFALSGYQPVWNPSTHAVVDCAAGEWDKADFPTIQAALDSGATWIEVRPCVYAETLTIATEGVTIDAQGAVLVNDGVSTSIVINAPSVALAGGLTLAGAHDGTAEGDFFQGVGVRIAAPYATISGLKTVNLRSFAVLAPDAAAHHAVIEGFDFRNVATDPAAQQYAPKAIMLINGASYNTVRGGYITGHAQGVGTWYGASHNTIEGNRLERNYGYVGNGSGYNARSAIEDYADREPGNTGNRFLNNRIDGARMAGFELADVLYDTVVSGNEVRNAADGFRVMGSGENRGRNITIEGNTFYGDGDDGNNWFSGSGVIRDNLFIGWVQQNMGTIHIPPDGLGDVTIEGNTFTGNGRVMRASQQRGMLRILDNRISEPRAGADGFVFQDNSVGAEIAGNVVETNGGYPISTNRAVPLWIHHNVLRGQVNISAGTVEANTIQALPDTWHPVKVLPGMVVRDNRIHSDTPFSFEQGAANALLERNYYTRTDGSAAGPLNCPPAARCVGNWTSGQVPPGSD